MAVHHLHPQILRQRTKDLGDHLIAMKPSCSASDLDIIEVQLRLRQLVQGITAKRPCGDDHSDIWALVEDGVIEAARFISKPHILHDLAVDLYQGFLSYFQERACFLHAEQSAESYGVFVPADETLRIYHWHADTWTPVAIYMDGAWSNKDQ